MEKVHGCNSEELKVEIRRLDAWSMLNAIHVNIMAQRLNLNPITLWEQLNCRAAIKDCDLRAVRTYNDTWIERALSVGRRRELLDRAETSAQCLRCGGGPVESGHWLCSTCYSEGEKAMRVADHVVARRVGVEERYQMKLWVKDARSHNRAVLRNRGLLCFGREIQHRKMRNRCMELARRIKGTSRIVALTEKMHEAGISFDMLEEQLHRSGSYLFELLEGYVWLSRDMEQYIIEKLQLAEKEA